MTYKYLNASMLINKSPKEDYSDIFYEFLNEQFSNSTDVHIIQEENPFASNTYSDIEVRINHVIDTATGLNIGDDYKKLLFRNFDHATGIGYLYLFDDNYWIAINSETIKDLVPSVIVKRCNNVLRWIDKEGGYHQLPCSIEYLIKENRDYSTAGSSLVNPSGVIEVIVQYNSKSNLIRPNQRFLFGDPGNWTAYKVVGGGVNNLNNTKTFNNESKGFIRLTMNTNYINETTDDIVNGIADVIQNNYVLNILNDSLSGTINTSIQILKELFYNGNSVEREVLWSSSDETIASVDSNGIVSFLSPGECVITCMLVDNSNVQDNILVNCSIDPVDNYQISIEPNKNYVYENQIQMFVVKLIKNGIEQNDEFSFELDQGTISSSNFVFRIIDGNSFEIQNNKHHLTDKLKINCVSNLNSHEFEIELRGSW